ncbi:MAG: hypothetical protein ACI4IE_05640 [Eubacterium sp.]
MKMKIGFNIGESKKENTENIANTVAPEVVAEEPVRSVVTVRFENGREYPYYNDEFNLKVGDVVFVDGKLAGQQGRVTGVTTKFKVSLDYYKRVIARLNLNFNGGFERVNGFMLSKDCVLPFEQVNAWFNPPREDEEEFFIGEGYEVMLGKTDECEDVYRDEYIDGAELFYDDAVKYISVKNGLGKAIVKSSKYHTVDFTLENGVIKNLYCDCISAHCCKHIVAVCMAIQMLIDKNKISYDTDFTALAHNLFYNVVSYNSDKITV